MTYFRATTLDDALSELARHPRRIVCGGTDCYADAALITGAHDWLDIASIPALRGIAVTARELRIGAATTWEDLDAAPAVPDALRDAARQVGSRPIRLQGTLGGNVCHASAVADGVPPLLALDADVELASLHAVRRLPLRQFLLGRRRTALRPGEILTAFLLSGSSDAEVTAFEKLANRNGSALAVVSAAVRVRLNEGRIVQAAVAVGSASEMPVRMHELEAALAGADLDTLSSQVGAAAMPELSPIADCRGSAHLRRHWARVAVERSLRRCLKEAHSAARR